MVFSHLWYTKIILCWEFQIFYEWSSRKNVSNFDVTNSKLIICQKWPYEPTIFMFIDKMVLIRHRCAMFIIIFHTLMELCDMFYIFSIATFILIERLSTKRKIPNTSNWPKRFDKFSHIACKWNGICKTEKI